MVRILPTTTLILPILALIVQSTIPLAIAGSPWPEAASVWARSMVAKMSLNDLIQYTYGHEIPPHEPSVIPAYPQFGTPRMQHLDGPQGVCCLSNVTSFPSLLSVSMTWDIDLTYEFGVALGREQRIKGTSIPLAPAVNLARVPWCGRLFEYTGEDPFLASVLGVELVKGIQYNNISACFKHFVVYNQEYNRLTMSANVGSRVLHELYYPAFKAAVDTGVGSIMCSYNRINGVYACENNATLQDLKKRFGFKGWVRSDGGATLSTLYANSGLDQEMPAVKYFGPALQKAVEEGLVPIERVQNMVERILTALYALNMLGSNAPTGNVSSNARSKEHDTLARIVAEEATVLLKNDKNVLPIQYKNIQKIAVFGDNSTVNGHGSGYVTPPYVITPLQGLQNWLNVNAPQVNISVIYGGSSATNESQKIAKDSDICIVVVATDSSEGKDRTTLGLGLQNDNLVQLVAQSNPHVIVVARCPGPCLMPWRDQVSAILFAGMQGQEAGNALANVIFGTVNPSAKLTLSFPNSMEDTWLSGTPGSPVDPKRYPGTDRGRGFIEADYDEGLFIGYRYYNQFNRAPLWPFGFGMSYTTFLYSGLSISPDVVSPNSIIKISFSIKNVGDIPGSEISQLYINFPAITKEPPQLLKGFAKTKLDPQETKVVTITLNADDFMIFDETIDDWILVSGAYQARVGASSNDILLVGNISVVV